MKNVRPLLFSFLFIFCLSFFAQELKIQKLLRGHWFLHGHDKEHFKVMLYEDQKRDAALERVQFDKAYRETFDDTHPEFFTNQPQRSMEEEAGADEHINTKI